MRFTRFIIENMRTMYSSNKDRMASWHTQQRRMTWCETVDGSFSFSIYQCGSVLAKIRFRNCDKNSRFGNNKAVHENIRLSTD